MKHRSFGEWVSWWNVLLPAAAALTAALAVAGCSKATVEAERRPPVPVLAAGGIADGRGLAAALALGACGAVIGTRYCATPEALLRPEAVRRLIQGEGDRTQRTRVFDVARGYAWPLRYTGRALHNRFVERWQGREAALAADAAALEAFRGAQERGDFDDALVWGGEAVDLIRAVEPAGALTERIGREARERLRHLAAA